MKRVNQTHFQILEALNTYRFLTVKQMIRLGIVTSKYTASQNLKPLQAGKKPFVTHIDYGSAYVGGRSPQRLPFVYYLWKYGARWLAEEFRVDESEINYPKGVRVSTQDYDHRTATIDLHIAGRQFTDTIEGLEFDFFHTYFEHTGSNYSKEPDKPKRQALTKVPVGENFFIPDCIFSLTDPEKTPWLFVGEIYRNHTTKRTHNQLINHLNAMIEGTIANTFRYPNGIPKVLIVCEEQGAMTSLMKRLKTDPQFEQAEPFFLFKLLEQVRDSHPKDFPEHWQTFTGRKTNLFMQ